MANFELEHLPARRTGHVYLSDRGEAFDWLLLHGYAHTPEDLLSVFPEHAGHSLIAPEGFSQFYKSGFDGEVVSSWMTRKHRLTEIEDQKNWLDTIYRKYFDRHDAVNIGFAYSQGTATLMRWLADRPVSFDQVWIWAGSIPRDVEYSAFAERNKDTSFHFFRGDKDPFLSREYLDTCSEWAEDLGLTCQTHHFQGGHRIPPKILEQFIGQLLPGKVSSGS